MARSISGVVTLEGQPFVTRVVGVSVEDSPRVLNYTTSNPDGSYFMNVTPWTGEVMVYAVQDYGNAWSANTTLAVGDFIHPSTPNGYIFRVTTAGNTGTEEPTWPAQQTTVGDGGVQYEGERLIQPVINGYLSTELDSPSLFPTAAQKYAWYDVSDMNTLFQDSAMTIPVTADGDPVGAIKDKSGNDKHFLQTDNSKRPVYHIDINGVPYITFENQKCLSASGMKSILESDYTFSFAAKLTHLQGSSNSSRQYLYSGNGSGNFSTLPHSLTYSNTSANIVSNYDYLSVSTDTVSNDYLSIAIASKYRESLKYVDSKGNHGLKNTTRSYDNSSVLTMGNTSSYNYVKFNLYSFIIFVGAFEDAELNELLTYTEHFNPMT